MTTNMYYNQYLDTFDCDGKYNSVDKIIVFFKKRVIFKQYIPKKYKCFWYKNLQTL